MTNELIVSICHGNECIFFQQARLDLPSVLTLTYSRSHVLYFFCEIEREKQGEKRNALNHEKNRFHLLVSRCDIFFRQSNSNAAEFSPTHINLQCGKKSHSIPFSWHFSRANRNELKMPLFVRYDETYVFWWLWIRFQTLHRSLPTSVLEFQWKTNADNLAEFIDINFKYMHIDKAHSILRVSHSNLRQTLSWTPMNGILYALMKLWFYVEMFYFGYNGKEKWRHQVSRVESTFYWPRK